MGVKFINSTYPTLETSEGQIAWTIEKVPPGRARAIRFVVEAEEDGLFVSRANIRGSSLDGRQLASVDVATSALAGESASILAPPKDEDWLSCGEDILPSNYWNNSMGSISCKLEFV